MRGVELGEVDLHAEPGADGTSMAPPPSSAITGTSKCCPSRSSPSSDLAERGVRFVTGRVVQKWSGPVAGNPRQVAVRRRAQRVRSLRLGSGDQDTQRFVTVVTRSHTPPAATMATCPAAVSHSVNSMVQRVDGAESIQLPVREGKEVAGRGPPITRAPLTCGIRLRTRVRAFSA